MISKEQVEAAERRIAEAEKLIEADKELLAQYNEQISQDLHENYSTSSIGVTSWDSPT